jgi:hypothetical protein
MKKIIVLLMAFSIFTAISASAQTSLYGTNGYVRDTVTNTGAKVLFTRVSGGLSYVTIQVDITKISGTLGGTLIPVASNDGVTYYDISNLTTENRDTAYTVTNTASQGYIYKCKPGFKYYGVKWTGTGTMSGSLVASEYGYK